MSRSGKLLIAGFALLLVVVGALWKLSTTGDATASSAHAPAKPVPEASPEVAPIKAADRVAAAEPAATVRIPQGPAARPSIADKFAMPPDEEIPRRPDGKVIGVADIDVLREANSPTDELVRQCIAKFGDASISGTLMTTYVVARKKDPAGGFKVEVETTGIEEDESTIKEPAALVECMHKTALAMKFPVNTSPLATWARREMTVKDGVLTFNWVIKHGYIR
ncbi:MAG: hypothetical protein ABI867_27350 [Kofleriaceae bacterium]